MKRKNWVWGACVAMLLSGMTSAADKGTSLQADLSQSKVEWEGSKVTGKHNGTVALKSASMSLQGESLVGGSFDIDMSSITALDLKDDKESQAKLEAHLKNHDFFDVTKFPSATFKITKVEPLKGAKAGTPNVKVTGDLTIKDVTKPMSFDAEFKGKDGLFTGKMTIDRTLFGVKYRSGKILPNLGDKLIHDNFTINFNIKTKKS